MRLPKSKLVAALPYLFIFFVSFDVIFNLCIKNSPVLRTVFFVFFFSFVIFFYSYLKSKEEAKSGIRLGERIIIMATVFLLAFLFFVPILGIEKFWFLAAPPLIFIGIYVLISYLAIPFFENFDAVDGFSRKHGFNLMRGPLKADFIPSIFYLGTATSGDANLIPFSRVFDVIEVSQDFFIFTNTYTLDNPRSVERNLCIVFTIPPTQNYHRLILGKKSEPLFADRLINIEIPEIAQRYIGISSDGAYLNALIAKIAPSLKGLADLFEGITVMDGLLPTDLDIQIRDRAFFARIGYSYCRDIERIFEEFRVIYNTISLNRKL